MYITKNACIFWKSIDTRKLELWKCLATGTFARMCGLCYFFMWRSDKDTVYYSLSQPLQSGSPNFVGSLFQYLRMLESFWGLLGLSHVCVL